MITEQEYEKLRTASIVSEKVGSFVHKINQDFEEKLATKIVYAIDAFLQKKFPNGAGQTSKRTAMLLIREIVNSEEFKQFITSNIKVAVRQAKNWVREKVTNLWNRIFKRKK